MTLLNLHPEDVKAGLRKRFGTISDFERAKQLPAGGVHDVLRGRPSKRVTDAIESALALPFDSATGENAHSQNARAA